VCADHCQNGLCVGTCIPDSHRCNGSTRQVCNATGSAWTDDKICTLGCQETVCIEGAHTNQGNVETLEGPHVYQGCFTMELGGSVAVPANKTLEIWATCFRMTAGTTVSLGTGASFIVHASDVVDLAGSITGGSLVKLIAWKSLNDAGSIGSGTIILRADQLSYKAGASVAGTSAALYGASFVNEASFPGSISVMPPESLSSVTAPDSGWWNWSPSGIDISWARPFPGVIGYYASVGDGMPGPGSGPLTVQEHITLDASLLGPGTNRIRVVSINPTSVVGTYPIDLNVNLNVKPPIVSSSSHPVEGQWYSTPDLFLSWVDPVGPPAGTFVGYRFILDHTADTLPTATTGTYTTQKQMLMPGQSDGIWFFHIVNVDRLGRTSPMAAHFQVRIGALPANGNIAGHLDTGGIPLAGVHVALNGGLFNTYTTATGDYSFQDQVPALTLPYMMTATLPGYAPATAQVQVNAGATTVQNFTLTAGSTSSYRLGWETPLYTGTEPLGQVTFAMGARDTIIWSSINGDDTSSRYQEAVTIARTTGDALVTDPTLVEYYSGEQGTDVGWDGTRFYALDTYACLTDSSTKPGHGWSCLQMRNYDAKGQTLAGWSRWGNLGQVGSGSVAWNGNNYGTFFVSYKTLMFRELSSSLAFTDGNGAYYAISLTPEYGDLRQSARVHALWDGTNYGVLYQFDQCYFARYNASHAAVVAPVNMDACSRDTSLGLVFDGIDYHAAYLKSGTSRTLVLRSIGTGGALGASKAVADLGANGYTDPSLAFDRRNLLLAYKGTTSSMLEVRAPGDHSLVKSIDLGAVTSPQVSFNPQTAQGGIVYMKNGTLYFRSLYAE
jgi:hypothetical protein